MPDVLDRPAHGGYPPTAPRLEVEPDLAAAIAWCRLGGRALGRPGADDSYHRAKALGLLAQDDVWRATERGEGVLVALGLLRGQPAPERVTVHVLWATCATYPRPQFVAAWSDGLVDAWAESYRELREKAEREFEEWGDVRGWTFWTTAEHLDVPMLPVDALAQLVADVPHDPTIAERVYADLEASQS